jgi:hypothetical protein
MTDAITSQSNEPQPQAAQQPQPVPVDDRKATSLYANFCRVTGTPEEVIVDFGLNANPIATPTDPLVISQRVVVNFYTAKRLWQALGMTIQRHEAAFGVLETDVQKRVAPPAMRRSGV